MVIVHTYVSSPEGMFNVCSINSKFADANVGVESILKLAKSHFLVVWHAREQRQPTEKIWWWNV